MSLVSISGNDLVRSVKAGCIKLEHNRDQVDLLNVFPVPDGDTGTNMYLTLLSAVKEGEKAAGQPLGKVAKAISMGSLMGARGNSGVILSQVFRGFAKSLETKTEAGALDLAQALKSGSDTAYEAVMKPVEGTILTVVREAARAGEARARQSDDIIAALMEAVKAGQAALDKTPSLLPLLKQAGVVDAGGQGLIYFLEGMVEGLAQDKELSLDQYRQETAKKDTVIYNESLNLEYQYCTELLIKGTGLDGSDIRDHLSPLGDSLLVVGEDDLIKVHIHSNHPGKVLESCLQWGNLSDIKINNMLEEAHVHLENMAFHSEKLQAGRKKIGVVAVASGDGLMRIFESLGVDRIVSGGQTMNPSTEDLLQACQSVNAESVIILPNNSNVIMAARQAGELSDRTVFVIPTRSVVQGISAMIAFDSEGDINTVKEAMENTFHSVKYAEVTHAVRDSNINGFDIKEGGVIGLVGDEIAAAGNDIDDIVKQLLHRMITDDNELITVFYGQDVADDEAMQTVEKIKALYPECEVESHYGGQPNYYYYIAVE